MKAGRRRARWAAAGAVAVALCAALSSPAVASAETSVSLERKPDYANPVLEVIGDDKGSDVTVLSDTEYDYDAGGYTTTFTVDVGGGVSVGPDCERTAAKQVVCVMKSNTRGNSSIVSAGGGRDTVTIGKSYMTSVIVDGGGGRDDLTGYYGYNAMVVHGGPGDDLLHSGPYGGVELYGDDGDDRLIGGRYDNVLVGGPGVDIFRGKTGSDDIRAADGRADRIINCGDAHASYNDNDHATVDPEDGVPRECETYVVIKDNGR